MRSIILPLIIIIFNLIFYSSINAEEKIDKIFGIKLNSDISLYADVEDGKIAPTISTGDVIYSFSDKTLKNIDRDSMFSNYLIRTDKEFKVVVVNASINHLFEDEDFSKTNCDEDRNKFKNILINELNLDFHKFKTFYRKNIDKKSSFDHLWHDENYNYNDKSEEFRIMLICNYRTYQGKVISQMFLSWMSEEYYRKNVINRFEIIDKFDSNFISKYLIK